MKKQYKKPLTCELLVKSESLLYVMSAEYGGDGDDPIAPVDPTAKENDWEEDLDVYANAPLWNDK